MMTNNLSVSAVAMLQIFASDNKVAAGGHIFSRSLPISSSSFNPLFFVRRCRLTWQMIIAICMARVM